MYKDKVFEFDITLLSKIRVESSYRDGVNLNKDNRFADIKVFSNIDFGVNIDTQPPFGDYEDLIKYKLNKTSSDSSSLVNE